MEGEVGVLSRFPSVGVTAYSEYKRGVRGGTPEKGLFGGGQSVGS